MYRVRRPIDVQLMPYLTRWRTVCIVEDMTKRGDVNRDAWAITACLQATHPRIRGWALELLFEAFRAHGGNVAVVARELGVPERVARRWVATYADVAKMRDAARGA